MTDWDEVLAEAFKAASAQRRPESWSICALIQGYWLGSMRLPGHRVSVALLGYMRRRPRPSAMARPGQMMAERRRTMAEVLAIISLASGVIVILLAVIATRIANIVAASKALSK